MFERNFLYGEISMTSENTEENETNVSSDDKTEEEITKDEEEYEGRNWNKMIIAVAFVLIVVVLWYVISRL